MQNILIISFSTIKNDPRVMRQIDLLQAYFNITVAGFGPWPRSSMEFIDLKPAVPTQITKIWWGLKLLFGFYEHYYWNRPDIRNALSKINLAPFDLIIANDIMALPLSLRISCGRPVLIDAHEYSPREFDDKFMWRILFGHYYHYLCQRYLRLASGILTVCQGIADEYSMNYGVTPQVVHNSPIDQKLIPTPVQGNHIRIIHHGSAIRSRHLETMIELMQYLDARFTLDFMLVESDASYIKHLKKIAAADNRIRFIPTVQMNEICSVLNKYDIGIYLLPPVNFNHEHALPNKFFEFIQARLAIAIGPSPEMSRIVKKFNCGVVAQSFDPECLGTLINSITETELKKYKHASDEAAAQLNYQISGNVMMSEIQRILDCE